MSRTTQDISSTREENEYGESPAKKRKTAHVNGVAKLASASLLETLFQTGENQQQQQLQIVQTADGTAQILNAETLEALDGVVIAMAEPTSPNEASQQHDLAGKIWQVVPCEDSSGTLQLHNLLLQTVIAVDEGDDNDTTADDNDTTEDADSSVSAETLASMLRSPAQIRTLPLNTPSWALKLRECEVIGDSYRGWVASEAELDLILMFHKQQTKTYWGTRQSPSTQRQSTRLMWKSQYVPFDGIPFINAGSRAVVMECQYGPRRKGQHGKRAPESLHSGAFRQACPARIYVKKVRKYPQYAVPLSSDRKYIRMAMDRSFQELKAVGLQTHGEDRWYVQLPTAKAHEFHLTESDSSSTDAALIKLDEPEVAVTTTSSDKETNPTTTVASRMHPKLVEKIYELVQKREMRVYAIRKQLRKYVEHEMFSSARSVPDRHNLCYFPTVHDIQNHIFQAIKDVENGKLPLLERADFAVECDESEDGNSLEPVPSVDTNGESLPVECRLDISPDIWSQVSTTNDKDIRLEQEGNPGSNLSPAPAAPKPADEETSPKTEPSLQSVVLCDQTMPFSANVPLQILTKLEPTALLTTTGYIQVEESKFPSVTPVTLIAQSSQVNVSSHNHGPASACASTTETALITVTMGEGGEILHIQSHTPIKEPT